MSLMPTRSDSATAPEDRAGLRAPVTGPSGPVDRIAQWDRGLMHGRWGMYPLAVTGDYADGWMLGHSQTRVAMPRCNRCGYGHARSADCHRAPR